MGVTLYYCQGCRECRHESYFPFCEICEEPISPCKPVYECDCGLVCEQHITPITYKDQKIILCFEHVECFEKKEKEVLKELNGIVSARKRKRKKSDSE
jgi:hypothetical protein